MKKVSSVFRNNVIYGLVVIVPVAVIFWLLAKIVDVMQTFAAALGLDSAVGGGTAMILALLLLLVICFAIGAAVRTRIGSWSFEHFETTLLRKIPGYEIIKGILRGFADNKSAYPAAKIRLYGPGTAVLGFVMEENPGDTVTVFVPSVPTLTVGSLHVVSSERVTPIEAGSIALADCISKWGVGSGKILA